MSNDRTETPAAPADGLDVLLDVMRALRHPETGCPWDLQQDFRSILPHTIEEVYEVADAIERDDFDQLKGELGDLLFQIVFYAQLAQEQQRFNFMDIADAIADKLVRRHPHVFARTDSLTSEQQTQAWETQKAQERAERANQLELKSRVLDDIPMALPGMLRAMKIQKRVSRVGFDWSDAGAALDKVNEEVEEIRRCLNQTDSRLANTVDQDNAGADQSDRLKPSAATADALEDEIGDLLFSVINCARLLRIDPEQAMRRANRKFTDRFEHIEDHLQSESLDFGDVDAAQLETLWLAAKTDLDGSGRKP